MKIAKNVYNAKSNGWLCETDDTLPGFGIADLKDRSIWALFLRPQFESKGIGGNCVI